MVNPKLYMHLQYYSVVKKKNKKKPNFPIIVFQKQSRQ